MSKNPEPLNYLRTLLIDTLVSLGRSEAGAALQVADFEQEVRLVAIEETAHAAQRRAQRFQQKKRH